MPTSRSCVPRKSDPADATDLMPGVHVSRRTGSSHAAGPSKSLVQLVGLEPTRPRSQKICSLICAPPLQLVIALRCILGTSVNCHLLALATTVDPVFY